MQELGHDLTFECQWCGHEFPAIPEAMVEIGFTNMGELDDTHDIYEGPQDVEPVKIDPDTVPQEVKEQMKREMGLSDKQVDLLLREGYVSIGAECVCLYCQGKADVGELLSD